MEDVSAVTLESLRDKIRSDRDRWQRALLKAMDMGVGEEAERVPKDVRVFEFVKGMWGQCGDLLEYVAEAEGGEVLAEAGVSEQLFGGRSDG